MTPKAARAAIRRIERRSVAAARREALEQAEPPVVICEPGETVAQCAQRLRASGRTAPMLVVPAPMILEHWESFAVEVCAEAAAFAAKAVERYQVDDNADKRGQRHAAIEGVAASVPIATPAPEPGVVRIVRIGR